MRHENEVILTKSTAGSLRAASILFLHCTWLPGEDGQQPKLLLVSKDLSNILPETKREAILIGARPKDWCSESLCRQGPTYRNVNKQRIQTQTLLEHCNLNLYNITNSIKKQ